MQTEGSLFQRLGGEPALAAVVEKLHERILADRSIMPFFEGVDLVSLKAHQKLFLIYALGGPRDYTGSLRAAHGHLRIGRQHFYAIADHIVAALTELGIDEDLNAEVLSVLEPLAGEIADPTVSPKQ